MFQLTDVDEVTVTRTLSEGLVPSSDVIVEDSTLPEPETEVPQPETEVSQPETEVPQLETEVSQPETEVPQLETEVPQPETDTSCSVVSTQPITVPASKSNPEKVSNTSCDACCHICCHICCHADHTLSNLSQRDNRCDYCVGSVTYICPFFLLDLDQPLPLKSNMYLIYCGAYL